MIREPFIAADAADAAADPELPRLKRARRLALLLAIGVLLGCLTLALAAWQAFRQSEIHEFETRFHQQTDRYLYAIQQDLRAKENLLRGAAEFHAASELVTAREWSSYVSRLNIEPAVSGILAMGYSQRVVPALRESFETTMRAGGNPAFAISPQGDRPELQAITHVAPIDGTNRNTLGLDLFADPVLQRSIERASDSGEIVLSPIVRRLGESNQRSQVVLMIQPVYVDSMPLETPAQRAQAFVGFLFLEMRVDVMARSALPALDADRHVRLLDTAATPAQELFASGESSPPLHDAIAAMHKLPVFGREWTLHFSDHTRPGAVFRGSAIVLISGILVSLLLALLTWRLAASRGQAELLARRITHDLRRSEMGLKQSRALLSSVVNGLPSAVLLKNESLEIQLANQAFCELVESSAAEVIGKRIGRLLMDARLADKLESDDLATLRSGDEQVSEFVLPDHRGESRSYQVRNVRLSGSQPQVLSIYTDITEVRAQGRLIRALIDHLPQRFMVKDRDSRFLLVNSKLAEDVGLTPEAMCGRCDDDFFPAELAQRYRADDRLVIESGQTRTVEEAYDDGWRRTTKAPLRDETGGVIGVVGILDDVTERRAQEEQLRESEARWQFALEGAGDAVWDWHTVTNKVFFSRRWKEILGYSEAEVGDKRDEWSSRVHPGDLSRVLGDLQGHLDGRAEVYRSEFRLRRKDGSYLWVHDRGKIVEREPDGRPLRVIGRFSDISVRKKAEQALSESEARFRLMADSTPNLVWVADQTGGCTYFNKTWFDFTGRTLDQECDVGWTAGVHPDDRDSCLSIYAAAFDEQRTFKMEYRLRRHDGEYRWLLDTGIPRYSASGEFLGYIGSCTDITERREMEAEVGRSRDLLGAINRLQDDFIRDPDSNRAFENMLGWLLAKANCEFGVIGEVLNDPDGARYMQTLAVSKIAWDSETGLFHQENAPHILEPGDPATLFGSVLASNQPVISNDPANDSRNHKPSSGHPDLTNFAGLPIRCGDEMIGMVGLTNRSGGFDAALVAEFEPLLSTFGKLLLARRSDMARKQAETELARHRDHLREMVEEQTREARSSRDEAQRANRVKSEFLANMSHELRTPMHAILSFAKLGEARTKKEGQSKLNDYFDRIRVSGDRLLTLLNDLLDLSKLEAGKMVLDLRHHAVGRLVREAVHEFEGMFQAKGVQLHIHDAVATPEIPVDTARIGQVLRNLLSNAVKFTPSGRAVEVRILPCEMPLGRRREDQGRTRQGVEVVVSDEGVGIPESELERVFDKFVQSTKTGTGAGGTGLGLAICREIVKAHHGTVFARPNAKGGTDLVVQLPASQNAVVSNLFSQG